MGKKKQPHYRIVVADSRSPRDGRFVENLGYYNPLPDPARLVVDLDRVDYWVGQGAVASDTVQSLVAKARAGGDDKVALGERAEPSKPAASESAAETGESAAETDAPAENEAEAAEVVVASETETDEVATDDAPAE